MNVGAILIFQQSLYIWDIIVDGGIYLRCSVDG